MPAMFGAEKGNIRKYPEIMTATPAPRANQNTSFSPGLKRPDGACFDLMKPPPCLIHSMSTFCGMLSLIQIATISTRPMTNETLTKLWVYLAICDSLLNASGPITGNHNSLPSVMSKPVEPRTTKDIAASQCEKRSKAWKHRTFSADRP